MSGDVGPLSGKSRLSGSGSPCVVVTVVLVGTGGGAGGVWVGGGTDAGVDCTSEVGNVNADFSNSMEGGPGWRGNSVVVLVVLPVVTSDAIT